jgi:hypothetical protein
MDLIMTATLTTKQIKDGAGNSFQQRVLDISGTGAGPFLPLHGLADPDGAGPIDVGALSAAIISAIASAAATLPTGASTETSLAAVLAKLPDAPVLDASIGGTDAAAAGDTGASSTNGFLRWLRDKFAAGITLAAGSAVIGKVIGAGPDFQATGLSAVSSAFTAAGSTAALAVKAGRDAMLEVSGTGVADLQVEVQLDGTNWRPIYGPDGATQLFRFAYSGTGFATFLPALPVAGGAYRVTDLTHTSGTVTVRLSQ